MISGNLFTRDYLLEGVTRTEQWLSLTDDTLAAVKGGLTKHARSLLAINKPNEAQTEKSFIYPVLDLLGWKNVEVQQTLSTKGRKQVPDALLFADEHARTQAVAEKENWRGYKFGLAITEAKRWGRALDRADKKFADEDGVPSTQMLQYMSRVDIQTSGKVRLGILTNGVKWRLYFQGALSVSEDYFELDLAKALDLPGHDLDLFDQADKRVTRDHCLRLFILMFGKAAFLPAEGFRTFHDISREVGKLWEERVTKDLSKLVFNEIFPTLVAELAKHDKARPATLSAEYLEDVRQGALVLLYRLLFVVYAEDRDLLPDSQEPYKSYSLTAMRLEIAEGFSKAKVFSASLRTYWPKLAAVFSAISEGNDELGIPPYNGGLFAADSAPLLARVELPDLVIADIIYKLSHRPDEETGTPRYINYRDLTVQQLGTIYERTLEFGLISEDGEVVIDADDSARHESGSYYTPDSLVSLIIDKAVGPFVEERLNAFRVKAAELSKDKRRIEVRLAELQGYDPALAILELRICDPAMGSGHFLVNLVDWLADKALAAIGEAETLVDWSETAYKSPVLASIDQTRTDIIRQATIHKWPFVLEHLDDRHIVRRTVLKRCIYGVDKNPMAVELAKVALWLHTFTVGAPLSFLDHHLRCGNSLFGFWIPAAIDRVTKWGGQLLIKEPLDKAMAQAQAMQKLERVNDIDIAEVHQSKTLFTGIEQETRPLNSFIKILYALDWLKLDKDGLSSVKAWLDGQFGDPFDIARGKLLLGAGDGGDGHIEAKDVLERVPAAMRPKALTFAAILQEARVLVREERFHNWQVAFPGVWEKWSEAQISGGFHAIVGNPPYVRQELIRPVKKHLKRAFPETYDGVADLFVYFYDQGLCLLRPGGRLSYVVTNKWLRAGYAEGLRRMFADKSWIEFIADFGHAKKFFPDADVFPSIIMVRRPNEKVPPATTQVSVIPRDKVPEKALDEAVAKHTFTLPRTYFGKDSWTLEPPDVIALLKKITGGHKTLEDYAGVKPLYGIKTGLNETFLIDTATKERLVAADANSENLIKPYLRGQDIERWWSPSPQLWMIFTRKGTVIDDYPAIRDYLQTFRQRLEPKPENWKPKKKGEKWKGRKAGTYAWYEVQDPVDYHDEFNHPKILVKRIAFYPEFSVDTSKMHVNDSALIIRNTDPWLLACLNSPLAWYFMFKTYPHKKDEAVALDIPFLRLMPIATQPTDFKKEDVASLQKLQKRVHEAFVKICDWLTLEYRLEKPMGVVKKVVDADADTFAVAIRAAMPKRQTLSAAQLAELKREYATSIVPLQKDRKEMFRLEQSISKVVSDAYGLTVDDVALMWRTAPPRMPFTPQGLARFESAEDDEDDEE